MKIEHEEQKKKGSFFFEKNGERVAELLYFKSVPGKITIYHTEVSDTLRGEGVGQELVAAAVKYARDNDLKIIPVCPYAKKVIDRTPEFRDILG